MSGEKRTLVTSFSSLKAGDYVECDGCPCGVNHRGILGNRVRGNESNGPAFSIHPKPPKVGADADIDFGVTERAVRMRLIYLIDTGLEASSTTTTTKRKKARI